MMRPVMTIYELSTIIPAACSILHEFEELVWEQKAPVKLAGKC